MMREEARFQSNFTSKLSFYEFPIVLTLFAFAAGYFYLQLISTTPLPQLLITLHFSILLYGLSTGAFAFLGKEIVDRRFGAVNFLLSAPVTLPVQFKTTTAAFYLKDAAYYLAFTLTPIAVGLALAQPFAPYTMGSVLALYLAIILTFSYGLALSYAFSAVYLRSRRLFAVLALGFMGLLGLAGFAGVLPIGVLVPPIQFQLTKEPLALIVSVVATVALSWGATLLVEETFESTESQFKESFLGRARKFAPFGRYAPLLAKEWIDLERSHALTKMAFSFAVPLVFLSLSVWFLNSTLGVSLKFDTVFYAGNVGFFGVMIYSWLNHIDITEYYDTLPLTVPRLIKAKLIVFFLVTAGITAFFVIVMAFINGEPWKLAIALPVAFATSAYTVVATAYLTGLRTNTALLNGPIIARFALGTVPPLLAIVFLSLSYDLFPALALQWIIMVMAAMMLLTVLIYGRIDGKWVKATFQRA
jgi:hypothetical protein